MARRRGGRGAELALGRVVALPSDIDAAGKVHWRGIADLSALRDELIELAKSWPPSLLVAIGVDLAVDDQRQW